MITNTIMAQKEARRKILSGVKTVADAVTSTLGPGGRNVIIENLNGMPPTVTKDGVSVARSIVLKDNFENMGAQMVIEVASKTNSMCGDGTTTATLLAYEIYKRAVECVENGEEPMNVKRSMLHALEFAKNEIRKQVVQVSSKDDLKNIATISANGDTAIGEMVADIIAQTGKDGIVVVQEGSSLETTWSVTKGVRLDSGFISPYFSNDPSGKCACSFADARILFFAKKISNVNELFPVMNIAAREKFPLVIIALDYDPDVISTLVVNRLRGNIQCCAIKAPGVMESMKLEFMTDAAIATGGTVINDDLGIKLTDVTEEHLGKAKRVDVTLQSTTFIDGAADKEKFDMRVNELRSMMESDNISEYYRHSYKERLAKLVAGIAVVKVGGETQSIIHEKRDRIDDAICSTREASTGGIVAGAGSTLLKIGIKMAYRISEDLAKDVGIESPMVDTDKRCELGSFIVGQSMQSSFKKIIENAGYSGDETVRKYIEKCRDNAESDAIDRSGFDVRNLSYMDDLVKGGVIDPANVDISALTNAVSVAALLISTDCMVGINQDSIPVVQTVQDA